MVIESAHQTLLADLAGSFGAAFALITPVMMFVSRGFLSGLVLMLPNIIPVLLVFGSMGWLGIRLDVASILTASVALGIAVDDTLHFVNWYQRQRGLGHTAHASVGEALQACARPMLHTSVICAAAMLPFLLSDFVPTSKFATLMILILTCALIGDLILLPALLVSPLGRRIGRLKIPSTVTSKLR
jgi:predicted RND superfamily exporter protein